MISFDCFHCEYCHKPLEGNMEYEELSDDERYINDAGYIVHKGCEGIFPSTVVRETDHLYLVMPSKLKEK